MLLGPASVPCYVQIIDIHRQENILPANLISPDHIFPKNHHSSLCLYQLQGCSELTELSMHFLLG